MIPASLDPLYLVLALLMCVTLLWLSFITFQFFSLKSHYKQLTNKTNKKDLQGIITQILSYQQNQDKTLDDFAKELQSLKHESSFHFQNIGFVRFNPFSDTGGEQSFVVAFLDKHKNGIVLTFLHNRDTTRVYSKHVMKGKSIEVPLSEEETKAITTARTLG